MEKRNIFIIIILIILLAAVYFTFFYAKTCYDLECFHSSLKNCERANYKEDSEEAFWMYKIKGKSGDDCKVYVKLLQLKKGTIELAELEGKNMDCYLPLGVVVNPSNNLKRCNGILKEEMQDVIINNLHKYIADNLGEIAEELEVPL